VNHINRATTVDAASEGHPVPGPVGGNSGVASTAAEYDRVYSARRRAALRAAFIANPASFATDFWRHVVRTPSCWLWTGPRTPNGYGVFMGTTAHRVSYVLEVAPIPVGFHLDHLCRNRRCVNPSHLEPVTLAENNRRAAAVLDRLNRPCRRGHDPLDRRMRSGELRCRSCDTENTRNSKRRLSSAGARPEADETSACATSGLAPAFVGTRSTTQVGVTT
jgi:hypothetical protein